jgi:hypothetical protein
MQGVGFGQQDLATRMHLFRACDEEKLFMHLGHTHTKTYREFLDSSLHVHKRCTRGARSPTHHREQQWHALLRQPPPRPR